MAWKQAQGLLSVYYVFNISLSCNNGIPSFIENLWRVLLLRNHLNDWPQEKQWVLFPRDPQSVPRGEVEAKQNSLFPGGPVILKCFVIPPSPKIEKKCEEIVCLAPADWQICCGFKELDLITCESKVRAFVELGDITTAFITLGVKESQVRKPKKTSQHVRKIKTIMAAHCGVPHNSKIEES